MKSKEVTDEMIIKACSENNTMALAIKSLELNHNTFIRRAKKIGCYKPNQGKIGETKPNSRNKTRENIESDFLSNLKPINSSRLKEYLIRFNYKENVCEICGNEAIWNNKKLSLQLEHKDGNHFNNSLDNLQIICPNCHSQTTTYCSKNINKRA